MRYNCFFGCLILVTFCNVAFSQTLKRDRPAPARPISLNEDILRKAIFDTASTFLGKVEATNRNDAAWISKINQYNGLPDRAFYCASAFNYVHRVNGLWIPVRAVGMVSSYFADQKKIIYRRNQRGNQRAGARPQLMDAVSLFGSHIEGLAETTFDPEADFVKCIGFNTTGGKGTKGGCYINRRRMKEIKLIANWITPTLKQFNQ